MCLKAAWWERNIVILIRRRILCRLIWVYTVCSRLIVQTLRVNTGSSINCRHARKGGNITKTCLYNFDPPPLKPQFYIVKLGFTGVYIIFLISAQKHRLWVLVRTASSRRFYKYPQSMFWAEIWRISDFFLSENFQFFGGKILNIFE